LRDLPGQEGEIDEEHQAEDQDEEAQGPSIRPMDPQGEQGRHEEDEQDVAVEAQGDPEDGLQPSAGIPAGGLHRPPCGQEEGHQQRIHLRLLAIPDQERGKGQPESRQPGGRPRQMPAEQGEAQGDAQDPQGGGGEAEGELGVARQADPLEQPQEIERPVEPGAGEELRQPRPSGPCPDPEGRRDLGGEIAAEAQGIHLIPPEGLGGEPADAEGEGRQQQEQEPGIRALGAPSPQRREGAAEAKAQAPSGEEGEERARPAHRQRIPQIETTEVPASSAGQSA